MHCDDENEGDIKLIKTTTKTRQWRCKGKQNIFLEILMRSLKEKSLSETLACNSLMMEVLENKLIKCAKKQDKRVAGFSEHFTQETHNF